MARMSGRRLAGWAARTVQIRCTDDLGIARIAPRSSIGASAHTRTPAEADSVLAVRVDVGAAGRQLRPKNQLCISAAIFLPRAIEIQSVSHLSHRVMNRSNDASIVLYVVLEGNRENCSVSAPVRDTRL